MLYQNTITSDNERLGKIVIQIQKKQNGNNWYSNTEKYSRKTGDTMRKDRKYGKNKVDERSKAKTERNNR